MRSSPAAAFAWEFRQRLGRGLLVLGAYLVVQATVNFLVLGPRPPLHPMRSEVFAFTVLVPLTAAFFHLVAVFSYGLAGDLAGRPSLYPARMFTLPVTTTALAGYPMLYGSLAMAGLWVAAYFVAIRPAGVHLPLVWPAVFLAAFLAWMQVFTWMPYGLRGLRAIAAVLALFTVDAVVIVSFEYEVPEPLIVAGLAPLLPLAFLAGRVAVGRARRGEVPDWGSLLGGRRWLARAAARPRWFLSSPRAQLWYEWRQHGLSLPGWVAVVLPFELWMLFVVRHEPAVLTAVALVAIALTPPFLAAFVATTVSRSGAGDRDPGGLSPFLATRPLTTTALVGAKLEMALASALAAWCVVLVGLPLGMQAAGAWPLVAARFARTAALLGTPRAAALVLLALVGLLASTWKQLVQGLCIGLTGRQALVKGSVLLRLCSLVALGPALDLLATDGDVRAAVWDSVPWMLAALAAAKMGAAAFVVTRLSRTRLIGGRAAVMGAAGWLAGVLVLYGVLAWLVDTGHLAPYFPLLLATLAVPLVRPSAASLALAWNRHRGADPTPAAGAGCAVRVVLVLFATPLALALFQAVSFHARNRNNGAIVSSGAVREYLLHVPRGYDPNRPTPLVISMHGAGMWPAAQMETSLWNRVADENGFLVVYPAGVSHGSPRVWRMGSSPGARSDVRFISDLIDHLQATYNVDSRRIYADGLSNGGGMAFVLSCALSGRIAAVGLVGSAQLLPWSWCTDTTPVPMIAFHGTADRFAPYHGGTSPVAPDDTPFASIPEWTGNWARRNRCGTLPSEAAVAADVWRREYTGCADDAVVVLYTIHGGGHTWPGGGPLPEWFAGTTSRGVDASRESWAFFRAHPLARRR